VSAPAEFESRLAWIFGSPRCGSTWLLRLLSYPLEPTATTPAGVLPGPPRRVGFRRRLLRPQAVAINEPYLPQHLIPLIPLPKVNPADLSSPAMASLNEQRHGDPHYFFCDEYADAWKPELRKLILTRLAAQVQRVEREFSIADPVVVIKEPNGSHGAEFMMSLLPESRLVFLIRDGRDVIDSLLDGMSGGGWLDQPHMRRVDSPEKRLAFARTAARGWLERTKTVERAFEAHPPELRWKLRYEDLRAETLGTLRPLVDWLGMERSNAELRAAISENAFEAIPPERKGPGTQRRAASPGLWRQNMSAEEGRAMEEIIGAKLVELGYDV
jgi:Sulfotransferase family